MLLTLLPSLLIFSGSCKNGEPITGNNAPVLDCPYVNSLFADGDIATSSDLNLVVIVADASLISTRLTQICTDIGVTGTSADNGFSFSEMNLEIQNTVYELQFDFSSPDKAAQLQELLDDIQSESSQYTIVNIFQLEGCSQETPNEDHYELKALCP